jgi:hypothetical protein
VRSGDGGFYAPMQRHYRRLILLLILLHVSVVQPSSGRNILLVRFIQLTTDIFLLEDGCTTETYSSISSRSFIFVRYNYCGLGQMMPHIVKLRQWFLPQNQILMLRFVQISSHTQHHAHSDPGHVFDLCLPL